MEAGASITTAEHFYASSRRGCRSELVHGKVRHFDFSSHEHGRVTGNLTWRLAQHVHRERLGAVYAAETGFLLSRDPDTVRAPDLAFVRSERVKALESTRGFFPGSPDLAIEVFSPSDSFSEVEEKVLDWLGAGCLAVVLLDPRRQRASLYRRRPSFRARWRFWP